MAYTRSRLRLWVAKQKIRLAIWLCHRIEGHIESVLAEYNNNRSHNYGMGAGYTALFLLQLLWFFGPK